MELPPLHNKHESNKIHDNSVEATVMRQHGAQSDVVWMHALCVSVHSVQSACALLGQTLSSYAGHAWRRSTIWLLRVSDISI